VIENVVGEIEVASIEVAMIETAATAVMIDMVVTAEMTDMAIDMVPMVVIDTVIAMDVPVPTLPPIAMDLQTDMTANTIDMDPQWMHVVDTDVKMLMAATQLVTMTPYRPTAPRLEACRRLPPRHLMTLVPPRQHLHLQPLLLRPTPEPMVQDMVLQATASDLMPMHLNSLSKPQVATLLIEAMEERLPHNLRRMHLTIMESRLKPQVRCQVMTHLPMRHMPLPVRTVMVAMLCLLQPVALPEVRELRDGIAQCAMHPTPCTQPFATSVKHLDDKLS